MQFPPIGISDILSAISLVFSACVLYLYLHERHLNKVSFINDYNKQIIKWYSKTILILMRLKHQAVRQNRNLNPLLAQLSAQIDIGRFYFPNINRGDGYGEENSTAYKGYRNLALDLLVASYKLYSSPQPGQYIEQAKHLHKYFTSVIFEVVRPQDNLDQIKKITDRFYTQDKIADDFHGHFPKGPVHEIWRKLT